MISGRCAYRQSGRCSIPCICPTIQNVCPIKSHILIITKLSLYEFFSVAFLQPLHSSAGFIQLPSLASTRDLHPQPSGADCRASAYCPISPVSHPATLIIITFPASAFSSSSAYICSKQLSVTSYICLNLAAICHFTK